MTTVADDNTPYKRLVEQDDTTVPNADAGGQNLFIDDADHHVKRKDSSGTVTDLESSSGVGDVVGPASATDNAVTRFDLTTGKLVQNSAATVDDSGTVNIPTGQTYNINGTPHAHSYGDASGPGSSTDNAITRFDGTTGKLVQNSAATVDDSGTVNIPTGQTYNINGTPHTHAGSGGDVTGPASSTDSDVALFDGTTGKTIKDGGTFGNNMWTQVINESGASFANFTAVGGSGTWSSDGTVIKQTDTASTWRTAKFATQQEQGAGYIWEAEVKLVSAGGSGTLRAVGLVVGYSGASNNPGPASALRNAASTKTIGLETAFTTVKLSVSYTFAEDTWIKLRLVSSGGFLSVYVDGVLQGTTASTIAASADARFVGMISIGCEAHFRNLKGWTLKLPA